MLRLVNMDVTNEDHVRHAVEYVAENLPAGQQGRCKKAKFIASTMYSKQGIISSLLSDFGPNLFCNTRHSCDAADAMLVIFTQKM